MTLIAIKVCLRATLFLLVLLLGPSFHQVQPGSAFGSEVQVIAGVRRKPLAHVVGCSVPTLRKFLAEHCPCPCRVVIADNGSTDGTLHVAQTLATVYSNLEQRGRGRALRRAWMQSSTEGL